MNVTYKVSIVFRDGRRWSKCGYSWEEAIEMKEHFLESVPAAIWGCMEPEGNKA